MKEQMIEKMSYSQSKMEAMLNSYAEGHRGNGLTLSDVIKNWAKNKQEIYKLFGEKLRIETPIDTELPERLIADETSSFMSELSLKKEFSLAHYFLTSLPAKDIANNTISESIVVMGEKINKGMKVSRALKFFVNPKHLDILQTKYSMFIQSFKCKGTLVLSIDPIDYLLMSENGSSGWRSCHNAFDGEYKVGTLSYIQDEATIIAYVKTKEVPLFGNEEYLVPNKIWRQCIYFDKEMTYAVQSRQYPGTSTPNRSQATKIVHELLTKHNNKEYSSRLVNSDLVNMEDYENSYHYNDILHGHTSQCRVVTPVELENDKVFAQLSKTIFVGYETLCLCGCGYSLQDGNFLDYETYCEYDDYY